MRLISKAKIDTAVATRVCAIVLLIPFISLSSTATPNQEPKSKEEKKEEKKPDAFTVKRLTQGMGLYAIGPVSPDRQSILLIAQKPEAAPNLYVMNLADHSIRPPLTSLKWGVASPRWSPDGQSVAFAGFNETASFDEIFVLDLKTTTVRQLTKNAFSDKEPVFTPDGKRVLYTSDESPLPDAAFGILHVAAISVAGGKPEFFTEDDCSSIHPGIAPGGKSVFLVKVGEASGRHSLWQYGFDGKPGRDLTESKFARIRGYLPGAAGGSIVLWAQEQVEQQDDIYLLDPSNGKVRELPEPDLPKHNPAVSPDGKLIAFIGPASFGAQLFLYDSTTDQIKQLTFRPGITHSPVFISNTEILFGSNRDQASELYVMNLSQPFEEKKKK